MTRVINEFINIGHIIIKATFLIQNTSSMTYDVSSICYTWNVVNNKNNNNKNKQ